MNNVYIPAISLFKYAKLISKKVNVNSFEPRPPGNPETIPTSIASEYAWIIINKLIFIFIDRAIK